MKSKPSSYPNPYFAGTHPVKSLRVILWLKTPTGKLSKFYESFMVKKTGKFLDFSKNEAISFAEKECKKIAKDDFKAEINKGYKLDEVYLYSETWN